MHMMMKLDGLEREGLELLVKAQAERIADLLREQVQMRATIQTLRVRCANLDFQLDGARARNSQLSLMLSQYPE